MPPSVLIVTATHAAVIVVVVATLQRPGHDHVPFLERQAVQRTDNLPFF